MAILGNISVGLSLAGAYLQWLSTQCYRTITCGKHPLGWSPEEEKLVTLARVGLGSASTDIVRSLEKHWMLDSKPIKGLQLSCVPAATFQTPGFRDSWWISLNPEQQPKQAKTSVAICFIHGGAFRAGDPLLYHTAYKTWLQGLAKLGVHARLFAVGYPLAPENRFPVPVQGCVEAYQWLVKQEGGSDHVILAGDSAGGNLVLTSLEYMRSPAARASVAPPPTAAAATARFQRFQPPLAAITISPAPDFRLTAPSNHQPYTKFDLLTPKTFPEVRKLYLQPGWTPEFLSNTLLSPVCCEDFSGLVQKEMLVVAGGSEMLLGDIEQFVHKVQSLGGLSIQYHVEEDQPHCYPVLGLQDLAERGAGVIVPFIASMVGRV